MVVIWLPVYWYPYAMQFPGIGPLYQLSLWLKKICSIHVNLCKITCAQVHFHETIDIKPQMDGTYGQKAMKHLQYIFVTWYHPQKGCIISRRFILNIWHVTQNRPRFWDSMYTLIVPSNYLVLNPFLGQALHEDC